MNSRENKDRKKEGENALHVCLFPFTVKIYMKTYMAIFFWSKMKVISCPGSLCYRDMYKENKSNNLQLPATFLYEVQGRVL